MLIELIAQELILMSSELWVLMVLMICGKYEIKEQIETASNKMFPRGI